MPKRKVLPKFKDYDQAIEWLESHSTADLESTEVQFQVASPLQIYIDDSYDKIEETIIIDKQLSQQIRQIAQKEGRSPQDLINSWLRQKVESINDLD